MLAPGESTQDISMQTCSKDRGSIKQKRGPLVHPRTSHHPHIPYLPPEILVPDALSALVQFFR